MNAVGWEGIKHIQSGSADQKDYSAVVQQALDMPGFTDRDVKREKEQSITIGFGYNTVMSVAGKVIEGFEKGQISRIFFIGGCDGAETERNYYRELALATPEDSIIITAGCGKYRFNKLDVCPLMHAFDLVRSYKKLFVINTIILEYTKNNVLCFQFGTVPVNGLPRLLDMGQCNDSFGAVKVALALAKHFKTDLNGVWTAILFYFIIIIIIIIFSGLPLSFAVSWFEQKAVAILLTLLHLGVKNIALGPNLPVGPPTMHASLFSLSFQAFVGPETGEFLTKALGLRKASVENAAEDLLTFQTKAQ